MDTLLPQTYLIGLTGLLVIVAVLVGRQLLKVRSDEVELIKLEKGGANSSKDAAELYELASVQLRKRLYPQATSTLKKALKRLNDEPSEAKALIENALGFALAAQEEFESAVGHYKTALKAKSDYPVALNNLAFAKQRLKQSDEASRLYKEVLNIDPKNKTATKQLQQLERQSKSNFKSDQNGLGF
jgi:tetratricopeptide (TPR) repeat protein